jgi:hypothetical protein
MLVFLIRTQMQNTFRGQKQTARFAEKNKD